MIDLIIIIITFLGIITGWNKGLFNVSNKIVAILLGSYIGLILRNQLFLNISIIPELWRFVVISSVSTLVIYIILSRITKIVGANIDKVLGGILGGILSWIIMSVVLIGLYKYPIINKYYLEESRLAPIVYPTMGNLIKHGEHNLKYIKKTIE